MADILRRTVMAAVLASAGPCFGFGDPASNRNGKTITVPVEVGVLRGAVGGDQGMDKTEMTRRLAASIKDASTILEQCGLELAFSAGDDVVFEVENPDGSGLSTMKSDYGTGMARKIEGKANKALHEKFKRYEKGFMIYVVSSLEKSEDETGVGYYSSSFFRLSPGFAIVEAASAKSGPYMAHEIAHGLGCLKHDPANDNLMNPSEGETSIKLVPKQCGRLRQCAAQRK